MTVTATIPITDDLDSCNIGYDLRYRLTSVGDSWTVLPRTSLVPLIITGLQPDTNYTYEVTRNCCDGSVSAVTTGTFTTPTA